MKYLRIILLICLEQIAAIKSEQLSIVGSHFVPANSKYTVFLHSKDVKKDSVSNIILKAPGFEESKVIQNFTNGQELIEFKIPQVPHPVYELQIIHKNTIDNTCKQQSVKLISISRRPVILIQLDKPVYNAGDEIKFRIFVLTQKLTPHKNVDQMSITIYDNAGNTQRKFNKVKPSNFGVYESSAKIAETPFVGKWMIEVDVDGKKRSKNFFVRKLDVNSIEVDIDSTKQVPSSNKKIFLSIKVKQPHESFFLGNITVNASGSFKRNGIDTQISYTKNTNINSVTKTLEFDIENDLNISSPDTNTEINFSVQIYDHKGVIKFNGNTKTTLTAKKVEQSAKLLRNKYFRPGIKFPIKIEINSLGDDLDNIFDVLKLNLKYYKKNNQVQEKTFKIKVLKTVITTYFTPPIDAVKVDINVQFNAEMLKETVMKVPSHVDDEFMQAGFIERSEEIGNTTTVTVETTAKFEILHALIIGSNGIAFNKEFPDAKDQKTFKFSFKMTEMMLPRSNLIIYYIRQHDGVIIHDYIPLSFQAAIDSTLELTAPDTAKATQPTTINVKAAPDSMVFLSANDQCSKQGNEILEHTIADEMFAYRHLKFSKSSPYQVNNLGAFVIEPLTASNCNESQPSKIGIFKDDAELIKFDAESLVSNYIPDIWYQDSFIARSANHSHTKSTPFASTTWKISGIAIHPISGLSIAQSQNEISVQNYVLPTIEAPSIVHVGEQFEFKYSVSNLKEEAFYADVTIKIENGYFMQSYKVYNDPSLYVGKCLAFNNETKTKTQQIHLPARGVSSAQKFVVGSAVLGVMKIKIEVVFGVVKINAEKEINVKNPEIIGSEKIISQFIEGTTPQITKTLPSGKNFVKIYGNILGPVLRDAEGIFGSQLPSDELKISKLAASVIAYKYLTTNELSSNEVTKNALNVLWLNYQESISVLQNILSKNEPYNLKLAAYVAQVFIDVQEVIEIGTHSIKKCLEFIKKHQNVDGSYSFKANDEIRNEIGSEQSKTNVIAALASLAFTKDKKLQDAFKNESKQSMDYLKYKVMSLTTDYEKAIAAYVFALNADHGISKNLILKITRPLSALTNPQNKAMDTEIISYLILAKIMLNIDPQSEFKWLMEQRNVDGGFYSTHDTILGLQALSAYSRFINNRNPNLGVKINTRTTLQMSYLLDERIDEISGSNLAIQVSGSGNGYAIIYHETDETKKSQTNYFGMSHEISVPNSNEIKLTVKFSPSPSNIPNTKLVIIKAQLPRGYQYIGHEGGRNIVKIDIQNDKNLIIFHVSDMENTNTYNYIIKASKVYEFYNHEQGYIKVYDHNRPNLEYIKFYKYDFNKLTCDNDLKNKEEIIRKRKEEEEARRKERERQRVLAEQRRIEEERRRAEEAREERERQRVLAEQRRIEEERKAEEARKERERQRVLAEQRRIEEERRRAEEARKERERREYQEIIRRLEALKAQLRWEKEERERKERDRYNRRYYLASEKKNDYNSSERRRCKNFWCWGCRCNYVNWFRVDDYTVYFDKTRGGFTLNM